MEYFSGRLKIIIIITLLIILLLSGLFIYLFAYVWVKPIQPPVNQTEVSEVQLSPFPKPEFKTWELNESTSFAEVQPSEISKEYSFKESYTDVEMDSIANAVNINIPFEKKENFITYTNYASNSASLLILNKNNTSFNYVSPSGIPVGQNFDLESSLYSFINKLGVFDESITLTARYQLKSQPGLEFYEFHRDWKKIGYPILSPVGLLNLPESQSLSTLDLVQNANPIPDEDIIETSDNTDGFARQTDFNTLTIAVTEDSSRIISIRSNIRALTAENTELSKSKLLTQEEALQNLKNGKHNIFLTAPAGDGAVDFNKVYPENKAVADKAVIEESVIAYFEDPAGVKQDFMKPYYVFRGYSELASGYRVRFIAAVSAIKDPNIAGEFIAAATPGVGGQQQNTLGFPDIDITATPSPISTIIPTNTPVPTKPTIISTSIPTKGPALSPTPTTPHIKNVCLNYYNSQKNVIAKYEVNGFQYFLMPGENGIYNWHIALTEDQQKKSSGEEILASIDVFFESIKNYDYSDLNLSKEVIEGLLSRTKDNIKIDFSNWQFTCLIRVSGTSPTLFVYLPSGKKITISPQFNVTYEEPSHLKNSWTVQGNVDSSVQINNVNRQYIYYEYEPLVFSKPVKGWSIERSKLPEFSKKIAKKLALNSHETSRLLFELHHASSNINDQYIFVGLIPQNEIDDKLSLSIFPQVTNIHRYHFYVKGINSKVTVKEPVLKPVVRTEEMILELGAIKGN